MALKKIFLITAMSSYFSTITGASPPVLWPAGMYGLPQAKNGCPTSTGFTWATGTIFQALNPNSFVPSRFHLQANATTNGVERSFCFKNSTNLDQQRPAWPIGSYCLYMKSERCPLGLQKGSLFWDDRFSDSNYQIGEVPTGIYTANTLINFCCSTKGSPSSAISLPNNTPFFLLTNYNNAKCQDVKGTLNTKEFIDYDITDTGSAKQYPPHPYKTGASVMTVYYCYYTPCSWNMSSLSGTIESPNYPSNYPNNLDCRWSIEVPKNYHITLIFETFELESSTFSCNLHCSCDWLKVTIKRPTNTVIDKYCMEFINYPLRTRNTYSNLVILDFHSNSRINERGFLIRYKTKRIDAEFCTAEPTHLPTNTTTTTAAATATTTTTTTTMTITTTNTTNTSNTTDITQTIPITKATNPHTVGSTEALNESSTIVLLVTNKTGQEKAEPNTWVVAVAVSVTVIGLLVAIGGLAYWRFGKEGKIDRNLLAIRYSSDSNALRTSRNSNTIDMYSGQDVEIIPESQLSDNPIYGSSVFLSKDNRKKDNEEEEVSEKSINPLYATPEDLKTDNPLYESVTISIQKTSDPKVLKSKNPLYERIM